MQSFLSELLSDARFALRQMRRRPGFAAMVIAVLALGIGSSSAVFSVLYETLLKPLPYPRAGELVFVHNLFPKGQVGVAGVSGFDYAEVTRRKDVFQNAGVYYYNDLTLTSMGAARHIDVVNASASVFGTLGVAPELGRVFTEAEDQAGAPKTVMLSDAFWRSAFAADPQVIGRMISLTGMRCAVIGVMPARFEFPSRETQMWIPTALRRGEFTVEGGRMEKWLHMVARLAPGVTVQSAEAALANVSAGLSARFPSIYPGGVGWHLSATALALEQTQRLRRWLYLAFGAVLSVFLIACINVGGLLLIRGHGRRGELAVRLAMGANKLRIVRQMLVETGVLALAGCGGGILFALWAVGLANRYGPVPQSTPLHLPTLLFGIALAILGTIAAGLLPALLSAQVPVDQTLRSAGSRAVTRTSQWRNWIVAAQVALAVTLTFTAAELSRSFVNLSRVPAGFDAAHVWSGSLDLTSSRYTAPNSWNTLFFEPLQAGLRAIPGVVSASGGPLPFNPSGVWTEAIHIAGKTQTKPPAEAQIGLALPGYFETMRIPLLRGRTFGEGDRMGTQPVAVVDEALAQRYFPGEDPIGKLVSIGGMETPAQVVGVVGSVHNADLSTASEPEIYSPELQERTEDMYLVVRTDGSVDPTGAVLSLMAKIDLTVALYDVEYLDQRVAASLSLRGFIAWLLSAFAGMGVLLAAIGLYASLANLVELRRREIGIRVALGAEQPRIMRLIFGRGVVVAGGGLVAGVAGALMASRLIQSQLFGVGTADPATWGVVLGTGAAIACLSTWLPAHRAARIDPAVTLREE